MVKYPPITQQFTNSLVSTPHYPRPGTLPLGRPSLTSRRPIPKGGAPKGKAPLSSDLGLSATTSWRGFQGHDVSWCVMIPRFYHEYVGMIPRFCQQLQYLWPMDFCKLKPESRICDGANHGFRWTFSLQQIEWNNQKSGEHVTFNKSMTPTIRKKTAQELKTARDRSQKRVWQHHFSMVVLVAMDIFGDMNGSILNCYITVKCLVTHDGCEIMWTWEMCRECDDMYMIIVISNSICSHVFVRNEYYRNRRPWDFSAHKQYEIIKFLGFTNNGGCQKVVNLVGKMVTNYIYIYTWILGVPRFEKRGSNKWLLVNVRTMIPI